MLILQAVRALQPDTRKDKDKELVCRATPLSCANSWAAKGARSQRNENSARALTSEVIVGGEPSRQFPFIHLQHTMRLSGPSAQAPAL